MPQRLNTSPVLWFQIAVCTGFRWGMIVLFFADREHAHPMIQADLLPRLICAQKTVALCLLSFTFLCQRESLLHPLFEPTMGPDGAIR